MDQATGRFRKRTGPPRPLRSLRFGLAERELVQLTIVLHCPNHLTELAAKLPKGRPLPCLSRVQESGSFAPAAQNYNRLAGHFVLTFFCVFRTFFMQFVLTPEKMR